MLLEEARSLKPTSTVHPTFALFIAQVLGPVPINQPNVLTLVNGLDFMRT